MELTQKTNLFEKMPIPKAVMQLAVPTVLTSLVGILYNLADTYFVGMMNDTVQNAAISLAGPLMMIFTAVTNLFGIGASSMMSRAMGAKDYETVAKSSAFGFYGSLLFSILYSFIYLIFKEPLFHLIGVTEVTMATTASYTHWTIFYGTAPCIMHTILSLLFRAEGSPVHASVGIMVGCFTNMILDPIFILPAGLNMGAEGAGLATFLANCCSMLYFIVLLIVKRGKTLVCIDIRKFCLEKHIVFGIFGIGIPAMVQNLLNVTGMTILNNFTSANGANVVAAMGIAQKINSIPVQIAMGISQSVMPLISYNYAYGNYERMKKSLFFTFKISLILLTGCLILYSVFAEPLVRSFLDIPEVVSYGSRFLRGFCLGMPFICFDFVSVAVFQAVGIGKTALLFAILRKIVLEIPFLFLLNFLFPIYGLAYAQCIAEVILTIIAARVLHVFLKRLDNMKPLTPFRKN